MASNLAKRLCAAKAFSIFASMEGLRCSVTSAPPNSASRAMTARQSSARRNWRRKTAPAASTRAIRTIPTIAVAGRAERVTSFIGSNLLDDGAAQEAGRTEHEHADDEHEDEDEPVGRAVGHHRLDQRVKAGDQQAADNGARHRAETTDHCGREADQPYIDAEVEAHDARVPGEEQAADRAHRGGDE